MMRTMALGVALALVSAPAVAQDLITSYEFRVYAAGASVPQIITPVPLAAVQCGLAKATGTAVNPTTLLWDDPADGTKDCRWIFGVSGSGPLVALPSGSYTGAMVASNTEGTSSESARVPFSRQRIPAVITGVRLIR